MGKKIERPEKVTAKDLSPTESRRQWFKQKVASLYAQIITIEPEALLNSYKTNEDILVLRGAAKRAGLEDYETADLTIPYVESIQEAIKAKAADKSADDQLEGKLNELENGGAPLSPQQKAANTRRAKKQAAK